MKKNRMVNTHFWDDCYITELDPIEKLLFLYLLTNPLTNIAGVYEIPLRRIAFDTGIDSEMVLKILARFEQAGKVTYRDGWICLHNFLNHQSLNPNGEKSVVETLNTSPAWVYETLSKAFKGFQSLPVIEREREKEKGKGKREGNRAHALPSAFAVTGKMREWASEKYPHVAVDRETEKFKNYHESKGSKFKNWESAWRNWIIKADDFADKPEPPRERAIPLYTGKIDWKEHFK